MFHQRLICLGHVLELLGHPCVYKNYETHYRREGLLFVTSGPKLVLTWSLLDPMLALTWS